MSIIINEKTKTDLCVADFDYHLPEELIAQHPASKRDASRLMVIDRASGEIEHKHFYDVIDYLNEGDTLVVNDSRVIPARLYGHAEGRPEAAVELLLLRQRGENLWETLVKPGKRARLGAKMVFGGGDMIDTVTDIVEEGNRIVKMDFDRAKYENDKLSPFYNTLDGSEPTRDSMIYTKAFNIKETTQVESALL